MTCLGLAKVPPYKVLMCGLALGMAVSSCKSSDGDGGSGGSGGEAGGGGDTAGKGGGGSGGSGGVSNNGGSDADAGVDGGLPPPPDPEIAPYAAPTGKLPVSLSFKTADDLNKNFFVTGEVAQSADSDGVLKVAKGMLAALTYDTKPDKERSDTFEGFTATIKFHSEKPAPLWISFATDKNRNDGVNVGFGLQNGRPGPLGVSDVDNIFYNNKCWAVSLATRGPQCMTEAEHYGWTVMEPSMRPQTVKVTVRADKDAKTMRARSEFIDDTGEVIDGAVYDWKDLNRVNGEITFGFGGGESDAFIDEITIKEAETIADPGIIRLDEGDAHMHVWVPKNLSATDKIKGLIITAPDLSAPPNGTNDSALFEHLRKFATAHGWALLGGVRQQPKDVKNFFKTDLAKLATKANRPEMNTVPIFVHHLLSMLSAQMLADEELSKRVIAFTADKFRDTGNADIGMGEKLEDYPITSQGRKVPGFITYCFATSGCLIAIKSSAVLNEFWRQNRFSGIAGGTTDDFALWAFTAHGAQTNAVVDSWMLYLALLQEMIAQRTTGNDGVTALKPVDRAKGYLGYSEASNIKATRMIEAPTLEPFTAFPPAPPLVETYDTTKYVKDFIPGPSTGLVWQAFDYFKQGIVDVNGKKGLAFIPKPVYWLTAPKHGKPGESRLLKLGFDASFAGWKKVEFFDALGPSPTNTVKVVAAGGAAECEYKNLTPGAHSFIAKVTAADDKIYFSHPAMAIFAP